MTQLADVTIGRSSLAGALATPEALIGLVIFAHGGSSRFSMCDRYAADCFDRPRLATLLFDPLSEAEGNDRRNVFDIALLGARMVEATDWARACGPRRSPQRIIVADARRPPGRRARSKEPTSPRIASCPRN